MLGNIIKELRAEKKITQEELGKVLGVTTSMVGMYETNARKPSYEVLTKISDYFNVTTDYLLGKSPFTTFSQEQHSIIVASMKYLLKDQELLEIVLLAANENFEKYKKIYTQETIKYLNNLIKRIRTKHLAFSDLEYFDLWLHVSHGFRWSGVHKCPVLCEIGDKDIACHIDYFNIPKISIDESSSKINFKDRDDILIEAEGISEIKDTLQEIPILENITDTHNLFTEKQIKGKISIPDYFLADFIIETPDNSLCGLGIMGGDLLICQKTQNIYPGQIVIAYSCHESEVDNNGIIIRLYTKNETSRSLTSAHPFYPDITLNNSYTIIGVVSSIIRLDLYEHQLHADYINLVKLHFDSDWANVLESAYQKGITADQVKSLIDIHIKLAQKEF